MLHTPIPDPTWPIVVLKEQQQMKKLIQFGRIKITFFRKKILHKSRLFFL